MDTLTQDGLVEKLTERNGAQVVTIVAETVPWMRKTNNPHFGNVRKISRVNGMINWIYANAVNRQREREGQPTDQNDVILNFVPAARKWGERVQGTPFVEHNGNRYLELKVQTSIQHEYRNNDDEVIPDAQLQEFLYARANAGRQEVEEPVILRDYTLTNIKQIAIGGEHFGVE